MPGACFSSIHNFLATLAACLMLVAACKSPAHLSRSDKRSLDEKVTQSAVFENGFSALHLIEAETGEEIYSLRGGKHFTPASNIKILALFTALKTLGDSLPLFHYATAGDTTIIYPNGGPTLFNPFFPGEEKAEQKLLELLSGNAVGIAEVHFDGNRFGPGWTWDGYPHNYQTERSAFPLYGNRVEFVFLPGEKEPLVSPEFAQSRVAFKKPNEDFVRDVMTWREEKSNEFYYYSDGSNEDSIKRYVPFITDSETLLELLGSKGTAELFFLDNEGPSVEEKHTLFSAFPDSIYRRMMWQSDNFLAEQLLIAVAGEVFDSLDAQLAIDYALDSFFSDVPDIINWYDGSGLSRYNLISPRTLTYILHHLFEEYGMDKVEEFFPAGGRSGTIRNRYAGNGSPFVFAKTGTLRNNHSLSGYLKAESGKVYIFSFMHSNFPGSSIPHREEMESILRFLYRAL
ncbi:MAG: hypothetical protein EA411_04425 [Saprospirales bacterium]|nr:MAG: hypothetical protein EA411_04425 [Saprospirales bacterium]